MMNNGKSLTVMQLNDSHAYFDLHQEMFWLGSQALYRPAGGYARIATIVKQIRAESRGDTLFCDCGDTLHGTYPAQITQGQTMVPVLNALALEHISCQAPPAAHRTTGHVRCGIVYSRDSVVLPGTRSG